MVTEPCFNSVHTSHVLLFKTIWTLTPRLLCPWDFFNKNTRVGCYFIIKGPHDLGSTPTLVSCIPQYIHIFLPFFHYQKSHRPTVKINNTVDLFQEQILFSSGLI